MTWTSRYWCKLNEYLLWELLFKTTISIKFPNSIYFFFDFNFGSAFVFRSFSFYFVYIFLRSDYGDSYYWKHHTRCDNGCSNTERHGEKLDLFNYARYDIYASTMCAVSVYVLANTHCTMRPYTHTNNGWRFSVNAQTSINESVCLYAWLRRWR